MDKMRSEGRAHHEMESLRCASAHWLRHTSATFDAPLRNSKDLQEDLRHSNLSTTQNTYYHAHDQEHAFGEAHRHARPRLSLDCSVVDHQRPNERASASGVYLGQTVAPDQH
ncbi:hypothetical protein PPUN15366_19660 [Pseudomonas putida]|nr:hypothetical protein PPUN15366_19660 [Pseudomonas putida]